MSGSSRIHLLLLTGLLGLVMLGGCATPPPPEKIEPATPSLEQFLTDASAARRDGNAVRERDTYRLAAQAYPTSKEPWLRLAQGYFDQSDYGNAILAAQEALMRDASDKVAASVLAVSGLRVSATALQSLRAQQNLTADTRQQAHDIVRTLREALGEPVLVPQVAEAPATPAPKKKPVGRPASKPAAPASALAAPVHAGAASAPARAVPPGTTPAAKRQNPFDALK